MVKLIITSIITVVICICLGFGLGNVQAYMKYNNFEERFIGSRTTLAESRGDMPTDMILAQPTTRGKLEVEGGTTFDFGTMRQGESMSHDFIFRNVGQDALNLEMGESTCKCTVGELDKSILQPGQETKVTLTWKAQSVLADFGQSATIFTSDPIQAEVQLRIMGRIAQSFVVEPSTLTLGSFSVNESISKTFHVFTYLETSKELGDFIWADEHTRHLVDFDVRKIELDPKRFPKHANARQVHEATVTIAPGLPMGVFAGRIQFDTDQGDKVGMLEVPISGIVEGDVSVFGSASYDAKRNFVDFGNVRSSEGASVTVWLAAHGEHRAEVKPTVVSVVPEDALQVTIGEPSERGNRRIFPIRFEVPKGAPEAYYPGSAGDKFGRVLINTNLEIASEQPIYVRLIVTK